MLTRGRDFCHVPRSCLTLVIIQVVVIGSGIGGLSAGAILAKYGRRVAVIEAHQRAGGACHGWRSGRFHFDSGATSGPSLAPSPSSFHPLLFPNHPSLTAPLHRLFFGIGKQHPAAVRAENPISVALDFLGEEVRAMHEMHAPCLAHVA